MKRELKRRLIFAALCISISLLLGLNRYTPISETVKEHVKYELAINEVMINNRNSIKDDEGDFEDWIEIYNKGDMAVNLHGFGLSNKTKQPFLWTFPDITIEPKSFLMVWASEKNKNDPDDHLHTNFKLKNKDKAIILTAPHSKWNNIFIIEPMGENISYGRFPDGSSKMYGFDEGTPGKANKSETLIAGPDTRRLDGPLFSHHGGFYTEAFKLSLSSKDMETIIYYTQDGSIPTEESKQYTDSIAIVPNADGASVIRARAYKEGYPKSEVITHSYFVEKNIYDAYNTPVISLVTDPKNLFDYESGIYVAGKIYDQWAINNPGSAINQVAPSNYNQRGKNWEREASIELFEPNGNEVLVQNIGIRISGGTSRANKNKSLLLLACGDYDDKEYFSYDFFDGKAKKSVKNEGLSRFSRILLRTSATDSEYALFRDALIQSLVQELNVLDIQSSKPCILYINGDYYGIRNIREAQDKSYIFNHYDMNEKDVVTVKNPTGVAGVEVQEGHVGDEMHYNRMIDYVKESDLRIDSNYNYIKKQIDIENFIEYCILEIYCDNDDWPGGNIRIWRKRTQTYKPDQSYGHDGRWRWMVFDLDHGFGLFKREKAVERDALARAAEKNGPDWPNPPWSTLLFRSLLENDEFKNQFINVFADRLNTIFLPEVVIEKIEAMKEIYYPNVEKHIIRWNLHEKKVENWLHEIEIMKNFAIARPEYIRQYITDYFGLSGTANIGIDTDEGGIVKINSLVIEPSGIQWKGVYFKGIPITVEAVPQTGYVFAGWEGINESQQRTFFINLSQDMYIKAIFEKEEASKIKTE